jgi:hypothetical protein
VWTDFSGVTPGCEVVLGALQKLRILDGLERAELTFQIGLCARCANQAMADIIAAKQALEHGEFRQMIADD